MIEFCGHPVEGIESQNLRLEYLTDIGPRIARLFYKNVNLFAELPDLIQETEYGCFQFMGGHRLWHAPEAMPRTYVPDQPVQIEKLQNGVRLSASAEPATGLAKSMEAVLDADRAAVRVRHKLHNQGSSKVNCAPWALTMLPLGGEVILPQPSASPGSDMLLPNRKLVLWPYTRIDDNRLHLHDEFISLDARAGLPPIKIGTSVSVGWVAYRNKWVFVKRIEFQSEADYPDYGCNAEVYCNDRFVELETLGPLVSLAPGAALEYVEVWEIYEDLAFIPAPLRKVIESHK